MPVIQASDDKTVKVILNSSKRSSGTINEPFFDPRAPVKLPSNHVGLCAVEGFFCETPTYFHSDYLESALNIFTQSGVNIWSAFDQANSRNAESLQTTFQRCTRMDMTQASNCASFMMSLLYVVPDLEISFSGILPIEYDGVTMYCTSAFMDQPSTYFLSGVSATTYAAQLSELTSFISTMNKITFTLSSRNAYVYNMRGPWLQCLGLQSNTTYHLPQTVTICTTNVPYLNINASFGRSVLSANTENKLVNSDILWTIPLSREVPGQYTYYTNFDLSGKISYKQSILEQLELYFTDPQDLPVLGMTNWTLILTFDFIEEEERSTAMTSKRARRYMV